jgi:hypothetical protein
LPFCGKAIEWQFELFPFSPLSLDRPLEKEKVTPLVTCFIESLFMAVDRGSFGKGQLQSPFVLFSVFSGTPKVIVNTCNTKE